MRNLILTIGLGVLTVLSGCGHAPALTATQSPVRPSAFRFFKVDVGDKHFWEDPSGIYAVRPDAERSKNLTDVNLYLSFSTERWWAPATAQKPFLLLGKLPGGRHPSDFEYRVVEVECKDMTITCNLDFTYYILPGSGPSVPQIPYFIAEMPGLPAGEYTIVFRVVDSHTSDGTNKRTPDKAKRDALATDPYSVKFKVMGK